MEISQNSSAIQLYAGDDLIRAKQWAALDPSELRRRAYAACRDREVDELWALTEAFMVLHGSAGAHISPHTKAAYHRGVAVLIEQWAGENLTNPSRDAAAVFVRSLEKSGLKPATVTVRLAAARMLYKALRWAGVLETDPLADVRPARDPTPAYEKRSPYSQSELDAMLAVASDLDRALILLGSISGLRVSECCALKWEHVDLDAGSILVVEGKGRKTASVTAGRSLVQALADLRRTSEYVLPYRSTLRARQRLRDVCMKAGTKYRAAHSLRHACGTRVYESTHDVLVAQRHLRHSSPQTTSGYVHWSNNQLRDSVGNW